MLKVVILLLFSFLSGSASEPVKLISCLKQKSTRAELASDELHPKIDHNELEISNPDEVPQYLNNLSNHDGYHSFMNESKPLDGISPEQSFELRYYILFNKGKKSRPANDPNEIFPELSTYSMQNFYIPLAQLLLQDFRKGSPSYRYLYDACATNLTNYLLIMRSKFNPYSKESFKYAYFNNRFPYDKGTMEKVSYLEEQLSIKSETEGSSTVKLADLVVVSNIESIIKGNTELREIIRNNRRVDVFCKDLIKSNPRLLESYPNPKAALIDLFMKYSYLFDFIYNSEFSKRIQSDETFRYDQTAAVEKILPNFEKVWGYFKDHIEEMTQFGISEIFYPEVFAENEAHKYQLKRTTSMQWGLNSCLTDDEITPFATEHSKIISELHAASSRRRSLEIPLISVNGQLLDLDQKSADH